MRNNRSQVLGLISLLVVAVILVGGGVAVIVKDNALPNTAEIQIGAAIVVGVSLLLVLLLIMAAAFALLRLSDPKEALGLPQGSIRALIALELILIFILMSLFLYRTVAFGSVTWVSGLSPAQVAAIPKERLDFSHELSATMPTYGAAYPVSGNGITDTKMITLSNLTLDQFASLPVGAKLLEEDGRVHTYEVTIRTVPTENGADLAQQLLTTVGTLVVAVAGFYFGSQAVAAARGEAVSTSPQINRIVPNNGGVNHERVEITNLAGAGFTDGSRVRLRRDDQKDDIEASEVHVISPSKITCTFNLKNKAVGKWDVLVINPNDMEGLKAKAFEIMEAESPTADSSNRPEGQTPAAMPAEEVPAPEVKPSNEGQS